jgi:hypothetical protein
LLLQLFNNYVQFKNPKIMNNLVVSAGKLAVVSVSEIKTASDDRQFFTVGFRAGFGQKTVFRNFWTQFKKDGDGIVLEPKELYWERATREEAIALMKSGELLEGRKVTHTVVPYYIGENVVSTYSTVVFPDENEITVFNSAKHPIVDAETGELIEGAKMPKAVISADPQEEEEEEDETAKAAPAAKTVVTARRGNTIKNR